MQTHSLFTVLSFLLLTGILNAKIISTNAGLEQTSAEAHVQSGVDRGYSPQVLPDDDLYEMFIRSFAQDHESFQHYLVDHPEQMKKVTEGERWRTSVGLRAEEYQLIQVVVLQANDRLRQNTKASSEIIKEAQKDPNFARNPPNPEFATLVREHNQIIVGLITTLKHELGDESFQRLDRYIRQRWKPGNDSPMPALRSSPVPPTTRPITDSTTEKTPQ